MPLSQEEHLEDLLRHKERVKDASVLLGKRLIAEGRAEFGKQLIVRGFEHDNTKFEGIEWNFLHCGNDIKESDLNEAIVHHQCRNRHHPEFHGGMRNMNELDIYEMVVDLYARSQEFATDLRKWIKTKANLRFHITECPTQKSWIDTAVNLLVKDVFVKRASANHK